MPKHKHADLMVAYAQDAQETETPWERWEIPDRNNCWRTLASNPNWFPNGEFYRRKPKTVKINGIVCPDDIISEPPETRGQTIYLEVSDQPEWVGYLNWSDSEINLIRLQRGLLHSTKEGAVAACKARHDGWEKNKDD